MVRDFGGIRYHQETLFASIGQRVDVLENTATEAKDLLDVTREIFMIHILINSLDLLYDALSGL